MTSKQTCIAGYTYVLPSDIVIKKIKCKYISVDNVYRLYRAEIVDVGRESNPSVTRRILIEERRRTYDLGVEILRNDEAKYLGVI